MLRRDNLQEVVHGYVFSPFVIAIVVVTSVAIVIGDNIVVTMQSALPASLEYSIEIQAASEPENFSSCAHAGGNCGRGFRGG